MGGDTTLINGVPWPSFRVAACKYRFRILNASNATKYSLALSSREPLVLIATDGGLVSAPVSCAALPLVMAERADVVIDFSKYRTGTSVTLLNLDSSNPPEGLLRFDIVRQQTDNFEIPGRLATIDPLPEKHVMRTRVFTFGIRFARAFPPIAWTINGRDFNPNHAEASPRLGDIEIWRLINQSAVFGRLGMLHPVHVHLSPFQVLRRNGGAPLTHEGGWKDTVALDKGEHVDIAVRFEQYRGRYLMHCHNLEHEDHNMMARFDVI